MRYKLYGSLLAILLAACGPKDECESQADCDDSDACTADVCSAGTCDNTGAVSIDDSNACTTDSCDPIAGVTHDAIDPDDNSACTTDACDPVTGVSNTTIDPDDNNACTTDSCDPVTGVANVPVAGIDDNNACTDDDCNPVNGDITHDPVNIDDGLDCTDDACDPIVGVTHDPIVLDDNNACTTDACDEVNGPTNTVIDPDDNNECTTDSCDPVTGVANVAVNFNDNNACTNDACDPITGVSNVPLAGINDNIDCTIDSCDTGTGVITHTQDNTQCAETDGATCSLPTCDAAQGGCVEEPINFLCGDSQACTTADVCDPASAASDPTTGCTFTIDNTVCDDTVGCTDDVCAPNTGCSNTADDNNCQSGEFCDPTADCIGNVAVLTQGVITEFMALGTAGNVGEFIEVHNPGVVGDIGGGTITNAANETAVIHPVNNPAGNGIVVVPAGGFVFGVPNPANPANIPPGAAFVYGDPGTTFEISDTGDNLALRNSANATLDVVNFVGNFVTNPDVPLGPNVFPGVAGSSTQLEPTQLTGDNGNGANWCTTFRLFDTAGAANLSCAATTVVINELVYDGALGANTDDQSRSFIELAGPGGARIADLRIRGVEGEGANAGVLQVPNARLGDAAGFANVRVPVDGLFVIADNTNGPSETVPANQRDFEITMENGSNVLENGSDSLQLVLDAPGLPLVLVDVLGYADVDGIQDPDDDINLFATFETAAALDTAQGISLARNLASEDTNNNAIDFANDPSPSPGVANQPVNTTVVSVTPNIGSTIVGQTTSGVIITGTDLGFNATITFAGVAAVGCNFDGTPTTIICNVPPTANGLATRGDVVYTNTADRGGDTGTLLNGWTFPGALNESNTPEEVDFCNLQFPPAITVTSGQATELIFGRIFEAGVTNGQNGFVAGILAEIGFGPTTANPITTAGWTFFPANTNVEVGNDDEYSLALTAPTVNVVTTLSYTYRFSFDGGINYTYCDLNGAGSDAGLDFEANQLGVLTVNP